MRVYVDTCVYNRPFDEQSQPRIWMESLALALTLQLVEERAIELVVSSTLRYENSRNPVPLRREWVARCLGLASHSQVIDDAVIQRAKLLEDRGLGALDALHVACAEASDCQYFVTCDDRLIRRYQGALTAIDPLSFVRELTGDKP